MQRKVCDPSFSKSYKKIIAVWQGRQGFTMNRQNEEVHMKDYIKNNGRFLLFVLAGGLIGGYCAGLYIPEMYSQEMLQQIHANVKHFFTS